MKKAFKILVVIASAYFVFMAISTRIYEMPKYLIFSSLFFKLPIITYNISVISIAVLRFMFAVFCLVKLFCKNKIILKTIAVILFVGIFFSGISAIVSFILNNQMTTVDILFQNFAFLIGIGFVGISSFVLMSAKMKLIVSIVIPSVIILMLIYGLMNIILNYLILLTAILQGLLYSLSLFVMLYFSLKKDENKNEVV